MAAFQTHTVRLVRSVTLSGLTKHLEFEMPAVSRFGFVPGQWLSFQQVKSDGEELTRAYSISSPPGAGAALDHGGDAMGIRWLRTGSGSTETTGPAPGLADPVHNEVVRATKSATDSIGSMWMIDGIG